MSNHLILKNKKVPISSEVCSYKDTKLIFSQKSIGCEKRSRKITHIVLHWTGGEGNGDRVYRVLQRRNLGVEFFVNSNGEIYQYADPGIVACRAVGGGFWRRSISIEIQNYGFRKNPEQIPLIGQARTKYIDKIHGRSIKIAHFLPVQIMAVADLVVELCKQFDVLPSCPADDDGVLIRRRLKNAERDAVGVLGHFHLTNRKVDPGTLIFRDLFGCP